ncbi:MAG: hypothetical protein SFW66_05785 [Gammaproteobacteria bacterium]|nr:hypothetical protein [Gammaproteobacteria bacterium]
MPARVPFRILLNICSNGLSQKDLLLLEGVLYGLLCDALKDLFRSHHASWFHLLKLTLEEEAAMIDRSFLRLIIEDTVASDTYDLEGIARYTQSDREVIEDIVLGRNSQPSIELLQRLLDLHRDARPDLYAELRKKITAKLTELE